MSRFTELLSIGYLGAGHDVEVLRPSDVLSRRVKGLRLRKLVSYVEQLVAFPIRVILLRRNLEWVHIADHSDALWLLWPVRARERVVTCHDLFAVRAARGEIPEHKTRSSGRLYQFLVLRGLRKATMIEAVSAATLNDVERIIGPGLGLIVHNPLSPSMLKSEQIKSPPMSRPFALVVSSSGWRKRRGHAIQVWLQLAAATEGGHLALAVVGPPLTAEELTSVPLDKKAEITEFSGISDDILKRLYEQATTLLQVSKYEGFGWPIVEANAFGTPAICSNEMVFREVGRGSTFICDVLEQNDWSAILNWINSGEAVRKAHENARRFSMEKFSKRLEEVRLIQMKTGPTHVQVQAGELS